MPFNEVSATPKPRKRPSFLDADPRFFVQTLVLPWDVLDLVRELVELRAELEQLESDAHQDQEMVKFLKEEVQTVFDVTEKAFYTSEEEAEVYEELRASARVLRATTEAEMVHNLLECLSYSMAISRDNLYSRIRETAIQIASIHTPE